MRIRNLVFHTHPRLMLAVLFGGAVWMLLSSGSFITRVLISWNAGVWTYLVAIWWMMATASARQVKHRAALEDENDTIILVLICIAATASIGAVVFGLSQAKNFLPGPKEVRYLFTGLTVLGSWFLVGTIFTLHYARLFYSHGTGPAPLRFPEGEENPDYWDFLYFSFTLAVAVQTSDVSVMTRGMRKTVLMQSILTFLFNSAILGLSINIAAGLIS
ncbi:DUF1345 domain-containing protein [Glaciimonas immobilis]|uniref:Putative membrane protein n=1 Tax=Glaciimonas immobilis TaxID=728004 RepID=A0A840RRQ0_9BURK|nr:DUF1345 domain-containing protein [Glaciimonas immobilis]KAF3999878.1 DUF1345 domain-containing protein [Glaciimonas immobilis]MBB5200363.1 putative membrane protein [Glaciimonas immobilis]